MTRTYQTRAYYSTPEPPPVANNNPSVHDLVIIDIKDRKQFGFEKYGKPLQAGNGRSLVDAYQESLDLACYLRKELEEQNSIINALLLMAQQYLSVRESPRNLMTMNMTAGEVTLDLLESLGYVEPNKALPEAWQFTQKAIDLMEQS
jgi:hypothetical protein